MPAWHAELGDVEFPTGEHAFQAAKALTVDEHERIRLARTPMGAKKVARAVALPADWSTRRAHVMLSVVRAKFATGQLRDLLLGTGVALLAEDSPYDAPMGLSRPRRRLQRPKPARAGADARPRRAARRAMTGTEYQPIGDLSAAERAWDRRLATAGHSALGWRILGRNRDGDLVAATTLPGPDASLERYCTATLTAAGLVYATLTRPRTPPQSPPAAPTAP